MTKLDHLTHLLPQDHPWGKTICCFDTLPSTNNLAKEMAAQGATEGTVVIAREQTGGRGRMGRSFSSPAGLGLYLSVILRPKCAPKELMHLTCAAAVAVRRAILKVTGVCADIKWVNDLYVNGKKVCGILSESVFCNGQRYVIIGVGINLSTTEFPYELADIAASLGTEETKREPLCVECINELLRVCRHTCKDSLMEEYKKHSCVLGKSIAYTENGEWREGYAEDINENGHLSVRDRNGNIHLLSSGEISLRVK